MASHVNIVKFSPVAECYIAQSSSKDSGFVIKHPRLTKLLENIKHPSPQRIVTDKEQPLIGSFADLKSMKESQRRHRNTSPDSSPISTFDSKKRLRINKPDIALQLGASSLTRRRIYMKQTIEM